MSFVDFYRFVPLSVRSSCTVAAHRIFKPVTKKHFSQFVKSGDLVFDVGAHVGSYTQLFLDLGAKVVAIDPLPYSVKTLNRKYGNHPRVTIVDKGVSSREGSLSFHVSTNAPDTSTFSPSWIKHPRLNKTKWEKEITVPVTTLDNLIDEYGLPDFIKIDVEGHEFEVFKGLNRPVPAISYEFDQEFLGLSHSCADYLSQLGEVRFNYSKYIPIALHAEKWLTSKQLVEELEEKKNGYLRGDVYGRFI